MEGAVQAAVTGRRYGELAADERAVMAGAIASRNRLVSIVVLFLWSLLLADVMVLGAGVVLGWWSTVGGSAAAVLALVVSVSFHTFAWLQIRRRYYQVAAELGLDKQRAGRVLDRARHCDLVDHGDGRPTDPERILYNLRDFNE